MIHSFGDIWEVRDAVGRSLRLPRKPERIVSLVPSQTELLVDLGVGSRLVGRTRYCIHPRETLASVLSVGGTKRVELTQVEALKPDLILAEKEENPREMVEALSTYAPVYVTDVVSISSAIAMCQEVGRLVGQIKEAEQLASAIQIAMESAKRMVTRPERVLYLIWRKPWMAAGMGTFIHSCLEHLGFENSIAPQSRYPELSPDEILHLAPARVFLSSEPYPFKNSHAQELKEILPEARIEFVNGELFSWYGSRMLKMPAYWREIFAGKEQPEVARSVPDNNIMLLWIRRPNPLGAGYKSTEKTPEQRSGMPLSQVNSLRRRP